MSMESQVAQIEAIKSALNTKDGLDALATAYGKTNDEAFKERLLYICWVLTFDLNPTKREEVLKFLKNALATENNLRLRNWAAASLVHCASPGMEGLFLDMLESSETSMWNHGAMGLWRIGSQNAVTALTNGIGFRRTNIEFVAALENFVKKNSNRWTTGVLRSLHERDRPEFSP